jgi:hypothetical protein
MNYNYRTLITTAWHALGLWMEETASRYANMLNKQLQTADMERRPNLDARWGVNSHFTVIEISMIRSDKLLSPYKGGLPAFSS